MKRATTSRTDTDSLTEQTQTVERDHVRHEETATVTALSEDETVTTTIEEFDTSQPADPATGAPPLKRRVTQSRERTTDVAQEQKAAQTETESEKTATDTNTTVSVEAQVETSEKQGLNAIQTTLLKIGGLAVLVLLVWLGWKIFKR